MRTHVTLLALTAALSFAAANLPAAPPVAAAGAKSQWPLLANGQIRAGELKVDPTGSIAFLQCEAYTPSADPSKPPKHEGGYVMVDLASGKVAAARTLVPDLAENETVVRVAPSPSGLHWAIVVMKGDTTRAPYTCFLYDRRTKKATKLTEAIGNMNACWAGSELLVSRNKANGIDSVLKFSADGKKLDMPTIYGMLLDVSADGHRIALVGRTDDLAKGVAFDRDQYIPLGLVVIDGAGKTIKKLPMQTQFCRLSPTGKMIAVALPDQSGRGSRGTMYNTTVYAVDSDKSWTIAPATTMLLVITDAGVLYTMDQPDMGPFRGNPPANAVRKWDAKGKSTELVKEAYDACVAGGRLYYVAPPQPSQPPTLKVLAERVPDLEVAPVP